jgi:type IV pilus assembly protein PilM
MNGSQPAIQKMEAGEFNPYHRWLGIRGAQTPPNHYRLLSLELWEADEEMIRDAFSRQSNHVRQFRTSGQRELCEQVLEELKNARDTLLDSRLKSAYDRWLKLALAQQPADSNGNSGGQPFTVHRDAAPAATSRAVACGKCGTENFGARKFCGGCGAELWEPCIECGVLCGPGELHCGGCGVNIASAVQKYVQKLENALNDATSLVEQGLTDIAVQTIEDSLSVEHPRLEKLRARAEAFIAEAQASKTRFEQLRQSALFEAGQLQSRGDFERAAAVLSNLPSHLHSIAVESLLTNIKANQAEAATLRAEIQQALAQKQFDGLLAKVNRLLELKPEPPIQKLQTQLIELEAKKAESRKKKLTELANAEIAQHNYARAAAILDQIADEDRGPDIEQLLEKLRLRAAEVAWLRDDLRLAVEVDEHSLPIAQRLTKLQPNDASAKKIVELIQQRLNSPAADAQKLGWPRKPAKGHWGFSIEAIGGFRRISISQPDLPIAKDPGGFAVAVGLALQGLNQAAIDTNLAPREKTGLLGKLTAKKRNFKTAWGIDIGQSAVKAVQLGVVKGSEQFGVLTAKRVPIVSSTDSESGARLAIETAIKTFLDETDLSSSAVCVSLPTRRMVNRMFDLPPVDAKKVPEIMQYEVKQHIPLPLDIVAWDYQVLEPSIEKTKEATIEIRPVALFAAKIEDVHALLAPFTERKITVDVLQSDCAALHNFCHYEQYLPPSDKPAETQTATDSRPVLAVLEIGASSSNIVVTDGHTFSTRGVALGGNDFTRALAKRFQLSSQQAEKLKHNPTAAPHLHLVYEAWAPIFEKLLAETWQPIDHYLLQDTRRTKFKLLIAGGSVRLHGLLRLLYHGT